MEYASLIFDSSSPDRNLSKVENMLNDEDPSVWKYWRSTIPIEPRPGIDGFELLTIGDLVTHEMASMIMTGERIGVGAEDKENHMVNVSVQIWKTNSAKMCEFMAQEITK